MEQRDRKPCAFRSAFQQKDGGWAAIREGEGQLVEIHSCLCEQTSAFHKEGSRQLPEKAQSALTHLEGTLESFYQEKREHFVHHRPDPFGNLPKALRAVLSNRYITGVTITSHIYNLKFLSGPIKKIQKKLIYFNNYFNFI